MNRIVPKSFLLSFVRVSAMLLAGGALLTAIGLYLAFPERGSSYADTYTLLASLNRDLAIGSVIMFFVILLLSLAGIILLAIAYSHRVAGPLHRLGIQTRRIASGDLADKVKLRDSDVVHVLADDLNSLSGRYHGLVLLLDQKTRELSDIMDGPGQPASGDAAVTGNIADKTGEIAELLNQIRL
jgi:methyl-accepting chemotaxis protein